MLELRHFAACALTLALAQPQPSRAATFKTVYSVTGSTDGISPQAPLIVASGMLYGTTTGGGATGHGTVFRQDPATGTRTLIYAFGSNGSLDGAYPVAGVIDVNNVLYGTTENGGAYGWGTVFKVDLATSTETVLHSFAGFADGTNPIAGLLYLNGTLYGTTYQGFQNNFGTVFGIDATTGADTVLHDFTGGADGGNPAAGLVEIGGILYGTTQAGGNQACGYFPDGPGCGTLFEIDPATGIETVLHSFQPSNVDGLYPSSVLTQVGEVVYGTTQGGGKAERGTVFRYDLKTGVTKIICSFTGGTDAAYPTSAVVSVSGKLYGTTSGFDIYQPIGLGTLYQVDPVSGKETLLHAFAGGVDGASPQASLVELNGTLYGTVEADGLYNKGAIFTYDPTSGAEAILSAFTGSELAYGAAGLLKSGDSIVLTSPAGGAFGAGQIVSFDSATGVGTTIYSFTGNEDGGTPTGAAVKLHGKLYGVTASGGAYGLGTVYMVNPADGRQMTLHGFAGGTDGASPAGPLVFFNGLLYGTTLAGGDTTCSIGYNGCGIIFSIDPVSGSETVLHAFQGTPADGAGPRAALIALNGELYGTASGGGTDSSGVIFKFDPASNVENVVFDFTGNNGAGPGGPLLEAEGLLYGTTVFGGTHCCGTLFSFDPATAAETVLHTFGRAKGDEPTAGLTRIGKRLYGATDDGGTADYGSLFGFDTATNTIKFLHQFSGADGGFAFGTPVNFQGTIYGTTSSGGTQSIGTIFAIQP